MGSIGGGGGAGGGGTIGGGSGSGEEQPRDESPVASHAALTEELVWKARAVRAESRVGELEARIAQIEQEMEELRTTSVQQQRNRDMALELALAEAIDAETASLLVERVMAGDESLDVAAAVAEVKRTKPFLFRGPARRSVMSGQPISEGRDVLSGLADEAKASGDRAALLRYLRARRGA
ncbi:MAG: hypothetical protein DYG94_07440 [Leptolyngbya sp. PLA3]|nr:MAG: hypothetical protein EDM82_06545 [Cyanobacteria bacterium CYA]MCE7968563.1 hypothetical protein [Leptolyngbya sp. PL-A3]